MIIAKRPFLVLLAVSVILCGAAASLPGASGIPMTYAVSASSAPPNVDVTGTWSGTFESRQTNFPFTMTVVISTDENGRLVGASKVSTNCLSDGTLQVTVTGSNIVLTGGGGGTYITLRGTIDATGTLMKLRYVIGGSTAKCESDDGSGNMGKR